jgi:hypothetical protein
MVFTPNKSTPDYLFEKANQCFRRSRTGSNARVELEGPAVPSRHGDDSLRRCFFVRLIASSQKRQQDRDLPGQLSRCDLRRMRGRFGTSHARHDYRMAGLGPYTLAGICSLCRNGSGEVTRLRHGCRNLSGRDATTRKRRRNLHYGC